MGRSKYSNSLHVMCDKGLCGLVRSAMEGNDLNMLTLRVMAIVAVSLLDRNLKNDDSGS